MNAIGKYILIAVLICAFHVSNHGQQDTLQLPQLTPTDLQNFDHQYVPNTNRQSSGQSAVRITNICGDYCNNQSFEIVSGYNRVDGTPIIAGYADNQWTLISDPIADGASCLNTIEPRPAYTINRSGAWDFHSVNGQTIGWISGYPSNSATCSGVYVFETEFCLSSDYQNASLYMSALCDNRVQGVWLNGNYIGQQDNINAPSNCGSICDQYGFWNSNRMEITNNDQSLFIAGTNVIRVEVYNAGVITGLSCYAKIDVDQGCIQCCNQNGSITGFKHEDTDGNGLLDVYADATVEGVTFNLIQNGSIVATTTSDELGMYSFVSVPPGDYSIEEVTPEGTCVIYPAEGSWSNVTVGVFGSIDGVNFLNTFCPFIEDPCETCIGSFAPIPKGEVMENGQTSTGEYLVTAWAKQGTNDPNIITYTAPQLSVVFNPSSSSPTVAGPFSPEGQIIDGWQRIEQPIVIPPGTGEIQILLESTSGEVYFDDIRMLPFDASMKSYVYDPINMRLAAELDERHYATFYEYDEEGKLVRIKKETEKGVMTIQETKSNSSK